MKGAAVSPPGIGRDHSRGSRDIGTGMFSPDFCAAAQPAKPYSRHVPPYGSNIEFRVFFQTTIFLHKREESDTKKQHAGCCTRGKKLVEFNCVRENS